MPPSPNALPSEAERAELERVVEALAKWPRLSQLLRYMGEKLFSGEVGQLNEYNIATQVLGRSKTVFNAAEDAIARVETHRLRKRLAEFYEEEGRDHPIQLALPPGGYVPVFLHRAGESAPARPYFSQTPQSEPASDTRRLSGWLIRRWKHGAVATSLVLVALGAYLYFYGRAGASSQGIPIGTNPVPKSLAVSYQPEAGTGPIRLLAGYSGPPRTDSAGAVWGPDEYFFGGGNWQRSPEFLARTGDPFIFEHSRTGDFSYRIPLKPGPYELHLFFSTPVRSSETIATFNAWINDEHVLNGFDVNSDAMGENIADERVFRDVSPDKDGVLRLGFSGATGPATLNAIEVLPGLSHAQLPIRLIMQTTPFRDGQGWFWHPDNYFMHGRLSTQAHPLVDSPEPDLFAGERYGHFSYAIPVDTRGRYTLVLHFAEFYFGSGAPGKGGVGSRLFKVMCNGEALLDNFDIYKEAGALHELTKTFYHLKPSAQGKLNVTFEPIVNNATISGIEVLDEFR